MNYEDIIERLLDEKHITTKEAIYLLKLCNHNMYYYQPTTPQPEITYKPYTTSADTIWVKNPYGYSTN